MTDIERAKAELEKENHSIAAVKGEEVYTSKLNGIAPLLQFIAQGTDLTGFSAADKIVGKAAALLMIKAGIKEVYGVTMSVYALPVFYAHGINFSYGQLVDGIVNRAGTGMCPMEKTVVDIDDPDLAFDALKKKVEELRKRS